MNEEVLRNSTAEKAMEYIKSGSVIGLGAGRNVACLIEHLGKEIQKDFKIKVVTPSDSTKGLCIKNGIEVLPTHLVENVDIAFDGCGEVDENFYASKGGGGVFTKEKIIAAMAEEYILLVDEQKLTKELSCKIPVSLEIVKDSLGFVSKMVRNLGGEPMVRTSSNKDGYLITDDGNFILDVKFEKVTDYKKINDALNNITGVVGTSLFTREVSKLIVGAESGVRVIDIPVQVKM